MTLDFSIPKMKLFYVDKEKMNNQERLRLRKLRIKQVRQISNENAARLRDEFKKAKQKEIAKVLAEKKEQMNRQTDETIAQMQKTADAEMARIGEAHALAELHDDERETAMRRAQEDAAASRALERGQAASQAELEMRTAQANKENAHVVARQRALDVERERAARVAKQPKPPPDDVGRLFGSRSPSASRSSDRIVHVHESNVFASTRYHMPERFVVVDRAHEHNDQHVDARESALRVQERNAETEKEVNRARHERDEKARLRGKHALEKEQLAENYQEILGELSMLQKADRERKQKELANIPREQEKNEFQHELERQFEKIYVDENLRKEEFPQPIDPRLSEASSHTAASHFEEEADLDLTIIDEVVNEKRDEANRNEIVTVGEHIEKEETNQVNEPKQQQQPGSQELQKLLLRIRVQRQLIEEKNRLKKQQQQQQQQQINEETSDTEISITSSSSSSSSNSNTNISISSPEESSREESLDTEAQLVDARDRTTNAAAAWQQAVMMSSHNVSSVFQAGAGVVSTLAAMVAPSTSSRLVERKIALKRRGRSSNPSVDLSHASRDPMLAGPKELLNPNEIKLVHAYKQKLIEKEEEELRRRLKEIEEQEALIENSTTMCSTSTHTTNNMNGSTTTHESAPDSSSSGAASASVSAIILTSSSSEEASNEMRRVEEYQQQILSQRKEQNQPHQQQQEFDLARAIELRKREIPLQFGLDLRPVRIGAGVGASATAVAVAVGGDKNTIYSSDSGFGSASAASSSSHTAVAAAAAAALARTNKTAAPIVYFSSYSNSTIAAAAAAVPKKPINLAVEKLNSEIQGMSTSKNDIANMWENNSEMDELKRRLSAISSSSSSSSSSEESSSHQTSEPRDYFGLEMYDGSGSWTSSSMVGGGVGVGVGVDNAATTTARQHETQSTSDRMKMSGGGGGDDDTDRDQDTVECDDSPISPSSADLDDVDSLATTTRTTTTERQLKKKKETTTTVSAAATSLLPKSNSTNSVPTKTSRHLIDLNVHELSTIKEVDTPMSERNLKPMMAATNKNSMAQPPNRSSLTQVSSLVALNSNNIPNEAENETTLRLLERSLNDVTPRVVKASSATMMASSTNTSEHQPSHSTSTSSKSTPHTTTSISASTPLNQQQQQQEMDSFNIDTIKLSLNTIRAKQQYLLNMSLFNSSSMSTMTTAANTSSNSNKTPSSSDSSSPRKGSKKEATAMVASAKCASKKWFDILASDNDKSIKCNGGGSNSTSSSNSNASLCVSTGPLSPTQLADDNDEHHDRAATATKKSLDYDESADTSRLDTDVIVRTPLDAAAAYHHHHHPHRSPTTSLDSISPSCVLINYSLVSQSVPPPPPIEKTLPIRTPSPNNAATDETGTTTSIQQKPSKSCSSDSSGGTRKSGLFDRFLKTYSSTAISTSTSKSASASGTTSACIDEEPEISFVSTATSVTGGGGGGGANGGNSNPSSPPTKMATSSVSTISLGTTMLSALRQQQKNELSSQFEHLSPIEMMTATATVSSNTSSTSSVPATRQQLMMQQRQRAYESDMADSSLLMLRSSSIITSSLSSSSSSSDAKKAPQIIPQNKFVAPRKPLNTSTQTRTTAANDRLTTVSSLSIASSQSGASSHSSNSSSSSSSVSSHVEQQKHQKHLHESSSLIFTDLEPVYEQQQQHCCKTCRYCRSFYTIHEKKTKFRQKENEKDPKRVIRAAPAVTTVSYFVDFDGNAFDIESIEPNRLQYSCLRHLREIRKRPSRANSNTTTKLNGFSYKQTFRNLEAKKEMLKSNRQKLETFNSYLNDRNRRIFGRIQTRTTKK